MSTWHGWGIYQGSITPKKCISVHVGPLPDRKQIALYTQNAEEGGEVLAYFESEAKAKRFLDWLDMLVRAGDHTQIIEGI